MQTIEFKKNYFGKLYCDVFTDIRPLEYQKFRQNSLYTIEWSRHLLGTGIILASNTFILKKLTDSMSLLNCGKGVGYQMQELKQLYSNITPETQMMHIVIQYDNRDHSVQEPLLTEWWKERKKSFFNQD